MSNIINGIAKDLKSIPKKLKEKTGNIDKKKLILMNLPYVLAGYFCDKVMYLWRVSPGQDASAKMMAVMAGMEDLFSNPLPSFHPKDLLIGVCCGIALRLMVYFKAKNAKKFRQGVEYGFRKVGQRKRHRALHGFCIREQYPADTDREAYDVRQTETAEVCKE